MIGRYAIVVTASIMCSKHLSIGPPPPVTSKVSSQFSPAAALDLSRFVYLILPSRRGDAPELISTYPGRVDRPLFERLRRCRGLDTTGSSRS